MKKSLGANTFLFPSPVWCIGSYDKSGKPNVMTASWGGICCSKPPAVSISLREATYTYANLMDTKAFTISVPTKQHIREADYFGIESGRKADKFEKSGLTPIRADKVNAPYVEEFPLVAECEVIHTHKIGLHTQFIGEILDIKIDEKYVRENGSVDMTSLDVFVYSSLGRRYFEVSGDLEFAFDIGKSLRKERNS